MIFILLAMWEANSITQKPQKLGHLQIASKMTILQVPVTVIQQRSKTFVATMPGRA